MLLYDWAFWARPKQLPPAGDDWLVWLIRSGRGFGKTRTGAEWVNGRARNGPYAPIALIGQSKADVRDTMIELGESSIIKRSPPWFMPRYEPSKRRLTWPNGMVAIAYSGDEPDQLRGPQHGTAWVDELAKFKYPELTWSNMMFGLRVGDKPQVCVTTTPRPIDIIRRLIKDAATRDVTGSTYENAGNLARSFIATVIKPYEGTRLGKQEIDGGLLDDVVGALWTIKLLEETRVATCEPPVRIVVAVDPPRHSAHCGISVAGIGSNGHGYLLDDRSLIGSPAEWGGMVVKAFYDWGADCVVGEVNQGGDMVEHTIRTVRNDQDQPIGLAVPYKAVNATRGKYTRAEPISSLYVHHQIHHVGAFADLETQMCNWTPGEQSPDRMDAMVWAFTELFFPVEVQTTETVVYEDQVSISPY